jgi:hypothetical protein
MSTTVRNSQINTRHLIEPKHTSFSDNNHFIRRRADKTAISLICRLVRRLGKTYYRSRSGIESPAGLPGQGDDGSTLAFILSAGMRHSAASKLNSDHSACRRSPGRTKTSGAGCKAPAISFGSVMVPMCLPEAGGMATAQSPDGSRSARQVATA